MERTEALEIIDKFMQRGGNLFIDGCKGSMPDSDLISIARDCQILVNRSDKKKEATMAEGKPYDVDNIFTYHKPFGNQPERYEALRSKGKELASLILADIAPSRERSLALTKLEEAIFWANASIARNETEPK